MEKKHNLVKNMEKKAMTQTSDNFYNFICNQAKQQNKSIDQTTSHSKHILNFCVLSSVLLNLLKLNMFSYKHASLKQLYTRRL